MWRRLLLGVFRIAVALCLVLTILWWFGLRMPGKNISQTAPLSTAELTLRAELVADVQKLAGEIGERNMHRYPRLIAAAEFIEDSFRRAGLNPRRDTYELRSLACHNIEAEIRGGGPEVILVGAHYDSVLGCPGANDNGTGVAALLALARRFATRVSSAQATTAAGSTAHTLRFVAFANEEPPYFQTSEMGSFVYAGRCKARGDKIAAMISLETIGYFSDEPRSQTYPALGIGAFYPTTANFIGFVSNFPSRALLRESLALFREQNKLPSEGAAMPAFVPGTAWSDQWSFWQHGYPGIMVTDTALFRYPHYHEASDTPDKLDYDRFTLVVSGMEKVIEGLDRKLK